MASIADFPVIDADRIYWPTAPAEIRARQPTVGCCDNPSRTALGHRENSNYNVQIFFQLVRQILPGVDHMLSNQLSGSR